MKLFIWQLDNREKFIRVLWFGLLSLLFLYVVVWYYVDDIVIKILLPTAVTILYIVELFFRYKKWKNTKADI